MVTLGLWVKLWLTQRNIINLCKNRCKFGFLFLANDFSDDFFTFVVLTKQLSERFTTTLYEVCRHSLEVETLRLLPCFMRTYNVTGTLLS